MLTGKIVSTVLSTTASEDFAKDELKMALRILYVRHNIAAAMSCRLGICTSKQESKGLKA